MGPEGDTHSKLLNGVGAAVILAGLWLAGSHSFLLFHGMAEMFTVAVAWSIFFLAWNTRRTLDNGYLLLVGIAFFFIGLVDLLHTLAYRGMHVFPGNGADLPTQLWVAGRAIQASAMLAGPLLIRRRLSPVHLFGIYFGATVVLLWLIFSGLFPACYTDAHGLTTFKVVSEYVFCLAFGASAILLYRVRERFHPVVIRTLMGGLVLLVLSELCFMLYISVYGYVNMAGHVFRLVAYYLIYAALLETGLSRPMDLLFRNLKQSEEKLRASEQRFRLAFENAPQGLFRMDARGVIVDCNPRLAEQLGVPADALLGFDALAGVGDEGVREALTSALAGRRANWEGDYTVVANGRTLPLRLVYNPIVDDQGRVVGVLGSSEDITERRQAEQLREEVERITRHDLKGPLNGIIGVPSMLMDDENLTAEQQQALHMLAESGYRMLRMINVSLDIYKMETGRYRFSPEEVDLMEVARSLAGEMRHQAEVLEVPLRLLLDGREPREGDSLVVQGEELLLYSMLSNIVENAMEASPTGETVTISLRAEGGRAVVEVHNMGVVPEEMRDRFFEKFATHGKSSGTGLGTYSAKLIVDTHGGDIGFATSRSEGTTVTVRLPL